MNKNLLIGLVVVILVIAGVMMVNNNSNTATPNDVAVTDTNPSEPSESTTNEEMTAKEVNTITLAADGFTPKEITVKAGDEVVWVNNSGSTATVDSAQHPTHLVYPKLNLGEFNDGEEHRLVFDEPGKYNYHNHLDPSMFGTVVVE